MKDSAVLIVLLVFGGIVVFVLLKSKGSTTAPTTSSTVASIPLNGTDPYASQLDSISRSITDLAGVIGKTGGGAAGAAAGYAVSSGEQNAARGLGQTPLTDQQIYDLSHNAAQNGLVIGTTAGANASSAAGGAAGAGPFDFIAAFFRGAASSELLRPGGVADQLGLPKA